MKLIGKNENVEENKKVNVKEKLIKGAKTGVKLLAIGAGAAAVGFLTVVLASAAAEGSSGSDTNEEEKETTEE